VVYASYQNRMIDDADQMTTFSLLFFLPLSLSLRLISSTVQIARGVTLFFFFFFRVSHEAAISTCSLGLIPGSRSRI